MSGSASSRPVTARWTQSVGVPLTNRKPLGARRTDQRPVERQRVRRAAAVALRRDDGDLGLRRERRRERARGRARSSRRRCDSRMRMRTASIITVRRARAASASTIIGAMGERIVRSVRRLRCALRRSPLGASRRVVAGRSRRCRDRRAGLGSARTGPYGRTSPTTVLPALRRQHARAGRARRGRRRVRRNAHRRGSSTQFALSAARASSSGRCCCRSRCRRT